MGQNKASVGQKRHPGGASDQTRSRNMAKTCSIDFPTPISYSTSYTLGDLSPTVKALLRGDGQQYANARLTRHSMFAMKPELEIWPSGNCCPLFGERAYLCMVSDKIVRISLETAEI